MLLLMEIANAEVKIRELKSELEIVEKLPNETTKGRLVYLRRRIDGFRKCAYIWRCFGDSIAFLYMDKFALKHTFFSTESTNAKQQAGFIIDKQGLSSELAALELALEQNVPALLVDLTNTIRHGDLCLMGEPDPHLIEVKSSRKVDRRGKRQLRNLGKIQTFYEKDAVKEFRGFREVRRETYDIPEHTYTKELNDCIIAAVENGCAICQPEHGLYYAVATKNARNPNLDPIFKSIGSTAPWVFLLNQAKTDRSWAPYLPFILSIMNRDHLWDFIQGNIVILVVIDVEVFCQIALERGYDASFHEEDADYPLHIKVAIEQVY